MNPIEWLRGGSQRRRADLDQRVLAELTRLGSAHELDVRPAVRTQHALLHASFLRLEESGAIGSRIEPQPGGGSRKVFFVQNG